jgi:hypothetical protein
LFPCPSETFNLHNLTSHHIVLLTLSLIHISVQATVLSVMFSSKNGTQLATICPLFSLSYSVILCQRILCYSYLSIIFLLFATNISQSHFTAAKQFFLFPSNIS